MTPISKTTFPHQSTSRFCMQPAMMSGAPTSKSSISLRMTSSVPCASFTPPGSNVPGLIRSGPCNSGSSSVCRS